MQQDKKVKIMLIDDHAVVRLGISSILEKNSSYFVCCEAGSISEMFEKLEVEQPDLLLLDYMLPDGDGATACHLIKKRYPDIKVLIVSALADSGTIKAAVMAGADGYLVKNIDRKAILETVEKVLSGKPVFEESALLGLIDAVKQEKYESTQAEVLTETEEKILDLLSKGLTNKEIAAHLYIAEKTVRNYLSRIMRKIDVGNRTEAALYWDKKRLAK